MNKKAKRHNFKLLVITLLKGDQNKLAKEASIFVLPPPPPHYSTQGHSKFTEAQSLQGISVARGQGAVTAHILFVQTWSVGTSSTFVGSLSLSVADFVCVESSN